MRSVPRILMVTPTLTNPAIQGNSARILAFGRELKRRGFDVEVLYYTLDAWTPEIEAQMRREWSRLHVLEGRAHREQAYAAHWGLDDWCPAELVSQVRRLCAETPYQAVVVNYVWLSACLEMVNGPLRILDTHDIFGDRARLAMEAGLEPSWYFTSPAEEARGFDRADIVLAIQDEERQAIAPRTKAPVLTVGHPVHARFLLDEFRSPSVAQFGYFASKNPWNIASIRALDDALAETHTSPAWLLAGSICREPLLLRSNPRILGLVDDPGDFYDLVDCVLNPMAAGTGLKIKTVEALAYGRPVLGTTEAYRGLEIFHPSQAVPTIADLAQLIFDYTDSPRLRHDIGAASMRTYVSYMQATQQAYDDLAQIIRQT